VGEKIGDGGGDGRPRRNVRHRTPVDCRQRGSGKNTQEGFADRHQSRAVFEVEVCAGPHGTGASLVRMNNFSSSSAAESLRGLERSSPGALTAHGRHAHHYQQLSRILVSQGYPTKGWMSSGVGSGFPGHERCFSSRMQDPPMPAGFCPATVPHLPLPDRIAEILSRRPTGNLANGVRVVERRPGAGAGGSAWISLVVREEAAPKQLRSRDRPLP